MKIFLRMLTLAKEMWPVLFGAVLLAAGAVAGNIGLMAVSAYLIAVAALQPPIGAISVAVVGVRFFGIARAVFRYAERYYAHDATLRLLSRLRTSIYLAVEPLAGVRMDVVRSDLWTRLVSDVDTIQHFYLRVLIPPGVALITFFAMLVWLSFFGWQFMLVLMAGFILGGLLLPTALYLTGQGIGRNLVASKTSLATLLADSINGLRDLAAFGQWERQKEKVTAADLTLSEWQRRAAHHSALGEAFIYLVSSLALLAVVVVAIGLCGPGGACNGVYIAMLALGVQSSFEAVAPLVAFGRFWEESRTAAARIFSLENIPVASREEPSAADIAGGEIECHDLSFRYGENLPWVLKGVSFKVEEGKHVAIVGPSGAGKSSLAGLLVGFGKPEVGEITLGGKKISDYSTTALREYIALVSQSSHIFNASLGDNLRLAKPSASDQELVDALEKAQLAEFVRRLPEGLDTWVGSNGQLLSGGQRQRLVISRAIVKKSPVLILDEPGAGLDAITERSLRMAAKGMMQGKTMIIITHKLTGLEDMDDILVLKEGQVVEQGRYFELLAAKGVFYNMWCLQKDILR
ncbi:MAG: thiol reductant exporter subunit CydC [Firmicutes bacterium]|nr:thiol reductant exporter subunit CydC [Bacillota bacterium]